MRRILMWGAIAILALFVVPSVVGFIGSLVFLPIAKVESWIHSSGVGMPSYITDREVLIEENASLKEQLLLKTDETITIDQLTEENRELRSLLGAASSTRIVAGVIGRPTAMPYDVLLLDRGDVDGVVEGAPVFVGRDQVIGFVATVYESSAVVVLATTPNITSTVYIFGPNIYTTAKGVGGGVLEVSVPQGIDMSEGDLVVLPSLQSGFFGRISYIDSVPTEPEQRGYVTLTTPIQSVRLVSVGDSSLPSITFDDAVEIVASVRKDMLSVPVPSGVLVEVFEDTGSSTISTTTATTSVSDSSAE